MAVTTAEAEARAAELRALLVSRLGEPEALYRLALDGEIAFDVERAGSENEEDDGEPPPRVLCPPVSENALRAAEGRLGFGLPPLLRALYRGIGNGGAALGLIGLEGGNTGTDLFAGQTLVEIYEAVEAACSNGELTYLPPGLVPINDDLGCGMADHVDCRTAEAKMWRTDAGELLDLETTLYSYCRDAIEATARLLKGED